MTTEVGVVAQAAVTGTARVTDAVAAAAGVPGRGGLAALVAMGAAAGAVLVLTAGGVASGRLAPLRRTQASPAAASAGGGAVVPPGAQARRGRLAAAALAGLGVAWVVGGVAGAVLGALAAVGCTSVLGRLEPRAVRDRRERIARDLPVAAGLMAGAVAAGATPVAALEVVAGAVTGPLSSDLRRVAAVSRLGGDVSAARRAVEVDAALAPLARTVSRAVETGAPLADALERLASDLHAERRFAIDRRARAVGVHAAAPLGLCFLPAFLLVGVVPIVAGIAAEVLGVVL